MAIKIYSTGNGVVFITTSGKKEEQLRKELIAANYDLDLDLDIEELSSNLSAVEIRANIQVWGGS